MLRRREDLVGQAGAAALGVDLLEVHLGVVAEARPYQVEALVYLRSEGQGRRRRNN